MQRSGPFPLLALDCSRSQAGVALCVAQGHDIQASEESGRPQASDLLPLAEVLLEQSGLQWSDLRGLVLVHGPGSFTGLRVAAGLVQGLGRSMDLPVTLVTGFEALAFIGHRDQGIQPAALSLDARLGEWFEADLNWSPSGLPRLQGEPRIVTQTTADAWVDPPVLVSQSLAAAALGLTVARLQAQEGLVWLSAEEAQPLYIRERVAQTLEERRQQAALRLLPMRQEDLASVMVIENQAYPFPWTSGNFMDSFQSGYLLRRLIDQEVLVGHCVWMVIEDEAHLLNFTISPARQRRGLGQWMLKALLAEWGGAGLRRCLLEVRPSNTPALGLYRRNGFEQIGLRRGYYPNGPDGREDALVLARSL
ncbi:MAG: hypothetical protein RLY30_1871 [Pseudomonadota bacterium]